MQSTSQKHHHFFAFCAKHFSWILLTLLGFFVSLGAYRYIAKSNQASKRANFQLEELENRKMIIQFIEQKKFLLFSLEQFFANSEEVTRAEFDSFAMQAVGLFGASSICWVPLGEGQTYVYPAGKSSYCLEFDRNQPDKMAADESQLLLSRKVEQSEGLEGHVVVSFSLGGMAKAIADKGRIEEYVAVEDLRSNIVRRFHLKGSDAVSATEDSLDFSSGIFKTVTIGQFSNMRLMLTAIYHKGSYWREEFVPQLIPLLLFSIFTLIGLSVNTLMSQKKEVERLVAVRTKELSLANVSLKESKHQLEVANEDLKGAVDREMIASKQALEALRLQDEFLAMTTHELRTPLGVISGWIDVLKKQEPKGDELVDILGILERNAKQELHLIDDLIQMAKLKQGHFSAEMERVEINDVIKNALETVRFSASRKKIEILVDLEKQSPKVIGDKQRLEQIVWNLLTNAVKFTPEYGCIRVKVASTSDVAIISVQDNGLGISKDALSRIFRPFVQQDSTMSRKYGGLGLGLAIAKSLIEIHGGTISVESDGEGKGAIFKISLPLFVDSQKSFRKTSGDATMVVASVIEAKNERY